MSPTAAAPTGATTTQVRRLATRDLATVHSDATLQEVAEELAMDEIGLVVVRDGHEPVGVVSERDVVAAIGNGGRLDAQAGDLVTVDLVTVPEDATVADVARLMIDAGIRHVLVRDTRADGDASDDPDVGELGGGPVTGIVSMRDVVGFPLGDPLN